MLSRQVSSFLLHFVERKSRPDYILIIDALGVMIFSLFFGTCGCIVCKKQVVDLSGENAR